jgi:hypothetical protein
MHASPRGWSGPGGRPVHNLHVMTRHAGVKATQLETEGVSYSFSGEKTQRLQIRRDCASLCSTFEPFCVVSGTKVNVASILLHPAPNHPDDLPKIVGPLVYKGISPRGAFARHALRILKENLFGSSFAGQVDRTYLITLPQVSSDRKNRGGSLTGHLQR